MTHRRGLVLAFLLVLPVCVPAQALETIYRWTDARGDLVISDRPPEDSTVSYETVDMGGGGMTRTLTQAERAAPDRLEPDTTTSGNNDSTNTVRRDPDICEIARDNLQTLDTFARIRAKGADGELRYLSEEEKEAQRDQARQLIEQHCN